MCCQSKWKIPNNDQDGTRFGVFPLSSRVILICPDDGSHCDFRPPAEPLILIVLPATVGEETLPIIPINVFTPGTRLKDSIFCSFLL